MKFIAVALLFVTLSAFAQDKPKDAKPEPEITVCIPVGLAWAIVDKLAEQVKRIADLERQLAERK